MDNKLKALVERHCAFWSGKSVKKPLISHQNKRVWKSRPYPIAGGKLAHQPTLIQPSDIDIDRITPGRMPMLTDGDLFNSLGCIYPSAWLEAVAGCPVYVSSFGCVARPAVRNIQQALETFSIESALSSPWLTVMDRIIEKNNRTGGDFIPVSQLHLRGVIDILAAYLGEEALCAAVYDNPEALKKLAGKIADLFIAVARRGLSLRKPWNNGFVSCWGLYAPGELVDYQIDASSLFSKDMYLRHFASYDQKVMDAFSYAVIHLHSVGLHLLDVVLNLAGNITIEISFDREAKEWNKSALLAACRKVQKHGKRLLIVSELSRDEFTEFLTELTPAGLAVQYWEVSITESDQQANFLSKEEDVIY